MTNVCTKFEQALAQAVDISNTYIHTLEAQVLAERLARAKAQAENECQGHAIGLLVGALNAITDEVSEAGAKHPVNRIQAVIAINDVLTELGLSRTDVPDA